MPERPRFSELLSFALWKVNFPSLAHRKSRHQAGKCYLLLWGWRGFGGCGNNLRSWSAHPSLWGCSSFLTIYLFRISHPSFRGVTYVIIYDLLQCFLFALSSIHYPHSQVPVLNSICWKPEEFFFLFS
jgi:hypothetical protein